MKLAQLCKHLEQIAPPQLADGQDNVGLLVGDADAQIRRVLLAIDLTDAVLAEALAASADLAVCYHPPIYQPLRKLRPDLRGAGARVFGAIRAGLALYAMHTNLDAAAGGTNDLLAEVLGIADPRPLAPHQPAAGAAMKLATFVPADAVERVAEALFEAGAGRIGDYCRCSFRVAGTGTFFGGEHASPAVGQAGRLERVEEVRLEMVAPADRAAAIVEALRRSHPYEEVAFDLAPLVTLDERVGLGRIGELAVPANVDELIGRIKKGLGVEAVWAAQPGRQSATPFGSPPNEGERANEGLVRVAACCAGSCGSLYRRAIDAGAGLYLTGEMRHHDALACAEAGMAVVAVRHSVSERLVLARLAGRLREAAGPLDVRISQADADPFRWA